jgi:hypothetical protein
VYKTLAILSSVSRKASVIALRKHDRPVKDIVALRLGTSLSECPCPVSLIFNYAEACDQESNERASIDYTHGGTAGKILRAVVSPESLERTWFSSFGLGWEAVPRSALTRTTTVAE